MAIYLKDKNGKTSNEFSCVVQQIKYINYLMPDLDVCLSEWYLVGMNIHSNCRRSHAISCSKLRSIIRYCRTGTLDTIVAVSFYSVL